jgi:lysyl-tRNA synthetase class 2
MDVKAGFSLVDIAKIIRYNHKTMEMNEIIQQRRQKLEDLKAKGVPLYPSEAPNCVRIADVLKDFEETKRVSLCGRIMARRQHGKVSFLDLKDEGAKIQLYIKADIVGGETFAILGDTDIADIISVEGELFKTIQESLR